jgi:hypothetical protein
VRKSGNGVSARCQCQPPRTGDLLRLRQALHALIRAGE